ncbi:MAG: diguanylate cyclase, partial [Gammaproteobacteria bacterium]|nr:diguanylate cyclase [Gammaproteobacteria bacterium]
MIENKRILLVDDNRDIHEDFRKVLCSAAGVDNGDLDDLELGLFGSADSPIPAPNDHIKYEVDSACQGEEALEKVRAAHAEGRPYAMAFMDVRMPPGWDGIQTIARIWIEFPYTEMVICTAFSDYSWEDIVAKLGSTDRLLFLTKPFDSTSVKQMALTLTKKWCLGEEARSYVARLERDVKDRTIQLEGLLEEVKKKNLELEYVSMHDALTDLPNRALFSDRLQYSANCAARDNQKFGVLVLDLDRFKEVNDVRGHHVGDQVLSEVGKRLREVLRDSDTVARMGGDEFAVILHNVNKEACMHVANKIGHVMEPAIMVDGASIIIGASVGIAMYPDHGENEVELLKSADVAMYDAKR